MKLSNSIKYAVITVLSGIAILFLIIYVEQKSISSFTETKPYVTLSEYIDGLNRLFRASVLFFVIVFSVFSWLLYRIFRNENLAKEALMVSEKRFRTIFEEAPLGIALIDSTSGIIHNANSKYLEIIGRSIEEMKSIDWMQITHPDDLQESLIFKKQMNEEYLKGFKTTKRYMRPDGSFVWVALSIATVETGNKIQPQHVTMAEDITDRKRIEEEITKSQLNFEEAEKLAKIGTWEFDLNTSEVKWSKGHYLLFEMESRASDVLYGAYRTACHPDDFHKIDENRENALKTGQGFNYEYRIIGKNGNIKYIDCIGEVVKNEEGKIIGLKGTGQDITDRKKMEELMKAKEQNALLLRHAAQVPGIIYQYQVFPDGRFLFPFVSDGVVEFAGMSAEEAMQDGLKVFRLVHPDDLESLMSTLNLSITPKRNWTHEFRINSLHNGIRWVRGNSNPEQMEDGSVLWHGYFTDITESKRAEEELKISNEKLEAVFTGSNDAIMLLTRKGFFDCNPRTLEMFGMSDKNEFIQSHPSDLSSPLQPDGQNSFLKANAMIEIAYEKGINSFEWIHRRKNGENFPAEVSLTAFNYGDERVLQATVHDVTERQLAKKKLTESEGLLSSILQTLPVAVFCKDINNDFRFSLWNKKAEEIFGLTAEECIGRDDYYFFSKKDADQFRKKDIEAIETKASIDIPEEVAESKDKRLVIHTLRTVVSDGNGTPRFLLGVSEDITERKTAEDKIKKSEEKYRSVVDNAADIIINLDRNNIIQFINHTHHGAPIVDVMGTKILNYVPSEYLEEVKEKLALIYEDKKSITEEMPGLHIDGSTAWFSINAGPLFFGNEVTGITLIIRDITERKNAEEKTRKSEEKYRSVVENAADIILTIDKNNIIQFVNHVRPGITVAQIEGKNFYNFVPQNYQELVKQKFQNVFESKKPQSYEIEGLGPDGTSLWYSVNAGPLFFGEEVVAITLISRDITENKKAEEKIRQSLKEKEVLLKEVHHRVKNNLQIMLSILNLQYANIADKKTLNLLRDIRGRIKAMSFIHELLYQANDFSRINFSEYINSITNNLIYSYTQNNAVDLKLEVGTIFLDLDRAIPCGLIINEVVTNALKYAFVGASSIERRQKKGGIYISLQQSDNTIQLIIADNGEGFPKKIDFRNTESLGMQLVVTLVQQLRGTISLDNSTGTKYSISFPI